MCGGTERYTARMGPATGFARRCCLPTAEFVLGGIHQLTHVAAPNTVPAATTATLAMDGYQSLLLRLAIPFYLPSKARWSSGPLIRGTSHLFLLLHRTTTPPAASIHHPTDRSTTKGPEPRCDNPIRDNSVLSPKPLHLVVKRQ
jgi:hypothetical protein